MLQTPYQSPGWCWRGGSGFAVPWRGQTGPRLVPWTRQIGRIEEDSDAGSSWYQLTQELHLLRHQFGIEKIDPRQIATRPGEASDKTKPDRVFGDDEEDRDRRSCCLCSKYDGGTSARKDHGDLSVDEFGRQFGHSIDFIFRPAVDDCYVVAFNIAGVSEALAKSAQTVRHRVR